MRGSLFNLIVLSIVASLVPTLLPASTPAVFPQTAPGANASENEKTNYKLTSIAIPKVNFDKLDISAVIDFLTTKSKELDPQHTGLHFNLKWPAGSASETLHLHREVNITIDDVPMSELLAYICQQTNLSYRIIKGVVVIAPASLLPPDPTPLPPTTL